MTTIDKLKTDHNLVLESEFEAYLEALEKNTFNKVAFLTQCQQKTALPQDSDVQFMYNSIVTVFKAQDMLQLYQELPEDLINFWKPHAYVIAVSYSGDFIYQISNGSYMGQVYYADHETVCSSHAIFEEIISEIPELTDDISLPDDLSKIKTDDFLAIMTHEALDGPFKIADSFCQFYLGFETWQ